MPELYGKSGASGGQGLERAHLVIKDNNKQKIEDIKVQFNPNSLKFSSNVSHSSTQTASGVQTTDTSAKPEVTLSVELLFDAISNNRAVMEEKRLTRMSRKSGRGTRFFPNGYGDVSNNVNSFYNMMQDTKGRYVEFMWGRMHFKGIITSINMNITLFDRQARPMRTTVDLQIKSAE